MVFEPNFTKVVSSVRKNVGMMQTVVEVKMAVADNNVSKILSLGAKSVIVASEIIGKDVVLNGFVDFQSVYMGDKVEAVDYTAEFKDKYVSSNALNGDLVVSSNILDLTSSIVGGGIRVVAVVEIVIDEIVNQELKVLTGTNGDNVHVSTNELSYSTYLGRANEKFDVSAEFELSGFSNVLMVTPCVSICSINLRENYLIVEGKVELAICGMTGENVNDMTTVYKEIDFNNEVVFDGVNDAAIVQSVIGIINNEMKVSTMVENGIANLNVYIPINYCGYMFRNNTIEIIEDLYVEKNYLSVTCENFETISNGCWVSFKDNISGTASIQETAPFIDEVLGVCTNNLVVASSKIDNEILSIEGIVNTTVAYYTKETNEITSVQIEMPFAVEKKVNEKCSCVVSMCLDNVSARSKRGKEIEVSAELNVFVDLYSSVEKCVVTEVVVGDVKSQEDCALSIYVVREKQKIWDIAKDLSVSQEMLLEQNPEIELPLKGGEKLVVYRPSIVEF